ncbi:MAG TPA: hypothetical protein GXZ89_00390 [Fastidiosipila sp.]|nr:hypothetical protein [Fastidiosipila sp.]
MKRSLIFLLTLLAGVFFLPGMSYTWSLDMPTEALVSVRGVKVMYGQAAFLLSSEDAKAIVTLIEAMDLAAVETTSVDQYYGQPTVPPGAAYELTIQKEGEADLLLSLVSALDAEERVLHRYDSETEDLDVLVLENPIAFQAYDQIFSLVEQKLYPQIVYPLLAAEPQVKVVSRGLTIDLTESDRETLVDFLSTLLGHQVNPPVDESAELAIEWDIPTSPIGLDRLLAGEHYDIRFGDSVDQYGLILLSETNTLPPVLVYTDLTRAITLRYEISEEKREVCDALIVFLASLSEH